ncbi:MAG: ClpX C4-type zinc finger protein [Pseudomonadota bacterium]|nr:ClpX C4-type zinc finger protein [Pseudomonadota bacterium]
MPTHGRVTASIHVAKFKARAKKLLKSVQAGDAEALRQVKPYFDEPATLKLTQAQLVVARLLGCSSWRQLVQKNDWIACSFCRKWQYELERLIEGADAYVCSECVALCNDILADTADTPRRKA